MKKLVSVLLSLAICLGLGGAAFADAPAEDGGVKMVDAAWYLGECLKEFDVTVDAAAWSEIPGGRMLEMTTGVAADPDRTMERIKDALDILLWANDFERIAGEDIPAGEGVWEAAYSHPAGAALGAVSSPSGGTACNAAFTVQARGDGGFSVVLVLGDGISAWDDDASAGGGSVSYDAYSAYLPSPDAWLGGMTRHEDKSAYGGRLVSFKFDLDDKQAAYDYVELLKDSRFQLTLEDTDVSDYTSVTAQKFYDYTFSYNGKTSVDMMDMWTSDGMSSAPVSVGVEEDYGEGTVLLTVYYADQFTFVDDGDRSELFPAPAVNGGGTSSSGGSSSGSSSSGGHWEWRTVEKDCPSCVGGACPICHGTGTYRLYGQEVACERDCSACDGRGTITQREYVYVND